jgi:hypothetical protein
MATGAGLGAHVGRRRLVAARSRPAGRAARPRPGVAPDRQSAGGEHQQAACDDCGFSHGIRVEFRSRRTSARNSTIAAGAKASRCRDLVEAKRLLFREPKLDFVDDGPGTPVSIQKVIGRRPLLAFGRRRSK